MKHITLIHGIRQNITDPTWPWRLSAYAKQAGSGDHFETEHYRAGFNAPWNILVVNPRIAEGLVARELLFRDYAKADIAIVAHSNGTNIAVDMVRQLGKQDIAVRALVLIGSSAHSDVNRAGLRDVPVKRCMAYCAPRDKLIGPLQSTPRFYGSLGTRGWEDNGKPVGLQLENYQSLESPLAWGNDKHRFVTRWFPEFGHSTWFDPEHRDETFECILADISA